MSDIAYYEPLPEEELRLSIVENTAKLAEIYRTRKGHCYVYGWTATGKSIIARRLAMYLMADYYNYELLSLSQWKARLDGISRQLLESDKKVIILDGFMPHCAGPEFHDFLVRLSEKDIQLFIFTQYPPFDDYPSQYMKLHLDINAFTSVIKLHFSDDDHRMPVMLHQVK